MKKYLLPFIAIATFAVSGLFTHFCNRTDDLSLRYVLWKNGTYPYYSGVIRSTIADRKRDDLIQGKTIEQVKMIFPDAHIEPANDYQEYYEKWDIKEREHLWLGDTEVIVFFKNGIAKEITLMKG